MRGKIHKICVSYSSVHDEVKHDMAAARSGRRGLWDSSDGDFPPNETQMSTSFPRKSSRKVRQPHIYWSYVRFLSQVHQDHIPQLKNSVSNP
ncbi:hypothetical protein AVEN_42978-1 [Araneus ventricosus]|uniref:Uncharacterized protein n=1 Tax=Araneus ventricosus TaxID=182803 RepID=A0A4Y2AGZ4_ARAVE|nr:hypothetical protein AVEN_42978-1 [Araneus ventricosus]